MRHLKPLYFIPCIFLISVISFSQGVQTDFVPTSKVPENIRVLQDELFSEYYLEHWKKTTNTLEQPNFYIAHFKDNTRGGYRAIYTTNGLLAYKIVYLDKAQLPETVMLKTRKNYDTYDIQNGLLISTYTPEREFYRVSVLDGNQLQHLYYTIDGIVMNEFDIPLEVQLIDL